VGKAEELCHAVGVQEIVDVYLSSHSRKITGGIRSVRRKR
jgi:hypothetical protein